MKSDKSRALAVRVTSLAEWYCESANSWTRELGVPRTVATEHVEQTPNIQAPAHGEEGKALWSG